MGCAYSQSELSTQQDGFNLELDSNLSDDPFNTNTETPISKAHDSLILARDKRHQPLVPSDWDKQVPEPALNGRTFLQSPLGKTVHFNFLTITPKRPNRTRESGEFCVPGTNLEAAFKSQLLEKC